MITVLIAFSAGVSAGWVIAGWVVRRVSRRHKLHTRPVEPVPLPKGARAGDIMTAVVFPGDPGKPMLLANSAVTLDSEPRQPSSDASADYDPRHAADPWGSMRPMVDAISAMREKGPVRIVVHEEQYPAQHSADEDPPDPREDRGW